MAMWYFLLFPLRLISVSEVQFYPFAHLRESEKRYVRHIFKVNKICDQYT
jgi:hypothetical protein